MPGSPDYDRRCGRHYKRSDSDSDPCTGDRSISSSRARAEPRPVGPADRLPSLQQLKRLSLSLGLSLARNCVSESSGRFLMCYVTRNSLSNFPCPLGRAQGRGLIYNKYNKYFVGMSCPSWQWHRTGYCWSPVRFLPVAPLWCDLGCSRTVVVIMIKYAKNMHKYAKYESMKIIGIKCTSHFADNKAAANIRHCITCIL